MLRRHTTVGLERMVQRRLDGISPFVLVLVSVRFRAGHLSRKKGSFAASQASDFSPGSLTILAGLLPAVAREVEDLRVWIEMEISPIDTS